MNSGIIPATPYFLSSLFRLSLIGSAIKLEFVGFTVMKTFPNCGGSKSSPPNAETDSASG